MPNCLCLWLHREIGWNDSGCPLLLYLTLSNFHFTFCLRSEDRWKVLGCPLFLSWQHFPAWQDIQASQAISPSHCRLCLLMIAILPPSTPPSLKTSLPLIWLRGSKWGWAQHCWKHCVTRRGFPLCMSLNNIKSVAKTWDLFRGANWIQWPG